MQPYIHSVVVHIPFLPRPLGYLNGTSLHYHMKVTPFLFLPSGSFSSCPSSVDLYCRTFPSFSPITESTSFMNYLVECCSASPSRNAIWFSDITSIDKLDILFSRFLLSAKANYPFAARFTPSNCSTSPTLPFRISTIAPYWTWILAMSFCVSARTVFAYPYL